MTALPSTAQAVVIHASEAAEDVQRAMSTAAALRASFPGARIRIIVNGDALSAVPTVPPQQVPDGVEVAVCSPGLRRRHIDETDMPAGVEILPAAPVAIIEEQFNGAAYGCDEESSGRPRHATRSRGCRGRYHYCSRSRQPARPGAPCAGGLVRAARA